MEDQVPQQMESRPKALNRLMMVPIALALVLAVATGLLVVKMTEDRVATGKRITLELQGDCLSSAKSTMLQRAEAVGVGDPVLKEHGTGMLFDLTLPSIPNAEVHIPKLLTRPGEWMMKDGDTPILTSSDVSKASLSLDESGMPETLLTFDPAPKQDAQKYLDEHPEGYTVLWLDDEKIIERPNSIPISDDFRLVSTNTDPKIRMMESADFVILLSSPKIDCPITWEIQKDLN